MPRGAVYEDRQQLRREGAQQFFRNQEAAARTDIMAEREINKRTRDERDAAFREAQMETRAQQQAHAMTLRETGVQLDLRKFQQQKEEAAFNDRLKQEEAARADERHRLTLATKASGFERDAEQMATKEKLQIAADGYSTIVARALPYVTPEQLIDVKNAAADMYLSAAHHPDTRDDIKDARDVRDARLSNAQKVAAAAQKEVLPSQKIEAEAATARIKKIDERLGELGPQWTSDKKEGEKEIESLRAERAQILQKVDAPSAQAPVAKKRFNPSTGKIEIIQ